MAYPDSSDSHNLVVDPERIIEADLQISAAALLDVSLHSDNSATHISSLPGDILDYNNDYSLQPTPTAPANPASPERLCEHNECHFDKWKDISVAFAAERKKERMRVMRNMLLTTAAPRRAHNDLGVARQDSLRRMKRKKDQAQAHKQRSSIVYAICGKQLCRKAFSNVVHLEEQTIQRHASRVVGDARKCFYEPATGRTRMDYLGVQSLIVRGFLLSYGTLNGLECPRGRGSSDECPLRLLSCTITRIDVHDEYAQSWKSLADAVYEKKPNITLPCNPLSYSSFIKFWDADFPELRIAKGGSDFCDLCTSLKADIKKLGRGDERVSLYTRLLQNHRDEASKEFRLYKQIQQLCQQHSNGTTRHFVFDFAEKVLLPRLMKQPGQLHFITGLKFDLFGVSSTNESLNYIFGLPEGHWPNKKTANTVVSMLHHIIHTDDHIHPRNVSQKLILHADNCSGQNKNKFTLWYLCWRALLGFDDVVELYFLVAGHTRNVCDGAFGHVKRRLKVTDAHAPKDMMAVISKSSETSRCVSAASVLWRDWKSYLGDYFKVPSTFKPSKYHMFKFMKSDPGAVHVRSFSFSGHSERFMLIDPSKKDNIKAMWDTICISNLYKSIITPLSSVPSPQQKTREGYLLHNVLDRYYRNNANMRDSCFGNGL